MKHASFVENLLSVVGNIGRRKECVLANAEIFITVD